MPTLLQISTTKVVMIVDTVSPTPFALLRRAKNFEYRDSDQHLQQFTAYDDPTRALTDECQRVLRAIANTNQSEASTSKTSTSLRDASWSRFEDIGFSASVDSDHDDEADNQRNGGQELRSAPQTRTNDFGRPTTPSWADFLSSGFADEGGYTGPSSLLLPPDKVLPPLASVRGQSSQSHKRTLDSEPNLDPGELASITVLDVDDSFWWVWISSLSVEEPVIRKAVFGRCALLETTISGAKWLVLEEQVKGAAPEPEDGAYIAEKKRFFGFSTRRLTRRKSSGRRPAPREPYRNNSTATAASKTSIGPDQHARIQAAAAALQRKHRDQEDDQQREGNERRGRNDLADGSKTNSAMTTGLLTEVSQAMKWTKHYDHHYDKDKMRSAYLSDNRAGTGAPSESLNSLTNSQRHMTPVPEAPSKPEEKKVAAPPLPVPPPKDAPKPANDVAADAATVPLPETKPSKGVELSDASEPKKSIDSTDESSPKKLKKKPNAALKGIFSTTKQRVDVSPKKQIGIDPSAVAAARAALENKVKSQDTLPPPAAKPSVSHRLSIMKKKPVLEPSVTNAPAVEEVKPASMPVEEEVPTPTAEAPKAEKVEPTSPTYSGPPRTRRDEEYDALSKIDTNEKAAAEHEFSSFDQGPLMDQPAFVPESPVTPVEPQAPEISSPPTTTSTTTTQDVSTPTAQSPSTGGVASTTSPSYHERWAQIRKNVIENASANFDDAPSRNSQADDGDTSGEESEYYSFFFLSQKHANNKQLLNHAWRASRHVWPS
jgi:hypothetical protein